MFGDGMARLARFDDLRREMDRLLDNFGRLWTGWPAGLAGVYPAMNVWDTGDTICVEAEVPGVRKEDLEVQAIGNELVVKGRRASLEGRNLAYLRQERGTGEFTRVLTLPCEVDPDRIEAVLQDGVLTLRLPKAASAKPRQIPVKTG